MFPVEVIDRILSEVDDPDDSPISKTTFEACSRVCSSWRNISQIHLFSHLTISRQENEEDEVQIRFVRCVAQGDRNATRLAQYIRFLYLFDESPFRPSSPSSSSPSPFLPLFHRGDPPIEEPLVIADSIISFLDQLQIVWGLGLDLEMSWNDIGFAGNKALLRLLRLNSIKTIHLSFLGGVPLSLLPLLGKNITGVSTGESGLTLEKPQFALESVLDSNESQTGRRPGPIDLNLSRLEDLEEFMSPLFKDPNPNYFTSLRSVSIAVLWSEFWPLWEESDIDNLRILLESCDSLSKIKFGRRGPISGVPYVLEIEFLQDHAPSTQNLNDSRHPRCHVVQSLWSSPADCCTYPGLAREILQMTLPASLVPQLSPTFPTARSSPLLRPTTHIISDVITSFTLNHYLMPGLDLGPHLDNSGSISMFSDTWEWLDDFLSEDCRLLERLSVNIDITRYPNMAHIDALVSEAEDSFFLMKTLLEGTNEGRSGFERNIKAGPSGNS